MKYYRSGDHKLLGLDTVNNDKGEPTFLVRHVLVDDTLPIPEGETAIKCDFRGSAFTLELTFDEFTLILEEGHDLWKEVRENKQNKDIAEKETK
jgi:hypothetical protein